MKYWLSLELERREVTKCAATRVLQRPQARADTCVAGQTGAGTRRHNVRSLDSEASANQRPGWGGEDQ